MKSEIASEKQTDLDKSVKEIEELLSQKYGSSPYESSVNYDQSDSDFNPWSRGATPRAPAVMEERENPVLAGKVLNQKQTPKENVKTNDI